MLKLSARSQRSWEAFGQRVAEMDGEVLEQRWLGKDKPHRCRCAKGHECRPRPHDVQQGRGICRVCAGNDPASARESFYKSVAELGGEVLEQWWLGSKEPHRCRCAEGHECNPRPNNVQHGWGICRVCAGNDPATARESFYKSVAELGGEVLEQRWLGKGKPHRCRCAEGHECRPRPSHVQQGTGICRICACQDPATARESFYKRVAELGGEVLEQRWLGKGKPHRCRCAEGHECRPSPASVQRGRGICLICAGKEWDVLYVVRDPVTHCVKFGITSRDGRARLGEHRTDGFTEVIRLEAGLPENLAVFTENKVKAALEMAGMKSVRGFEYFSEKCLALIMDEIGKWI